MCVQYRGGNIMSTVGEYHEYRGGISRVPCGNIMSTEGGISRVPTTSKIGLLKEGDIRV